MKAYDNFLKLANEIRSIFKINEPLDNTFGVDISTVGNVNICFIRVDTSWCSHKDSKCKELRIGDYQLSKLYKEYSDKKQQYEIDLTIAVSHYPLDWINPQDNEKCNYYFLSEEFLNVDILMCGHVHSFSAVNYFNHQHSLLTLVTGIGWNKNKPEEDKKAHRYSIYALNLLYNSCDIITRKKTDDKKYNYDYSLYIGQQEFKDNKLRFPLKIKENSAFIRINTKNSISPNSLFLNNEIVELMPTVAEGLASFSAGIASVFPNYKDNCLYSLPCHCDSEEETLYSKVKDYLYGDGDLTDAEKNMYLNYENAFNDFLAFLSEICVYAVEELKAMFTIDIEIRAHFRWHNHKEKNGKTTVDEYSMLYKYSNKDDDSTKNMQTINWGGLIKPAFESLEPIVYSANKGYNSISTEWNDFITLVPPFLNYKHDIRIDKGINEERPIITFGLSIKGNILKQDVLILYLLSYLRMDKMIARIIDDYICLFNIDTRTFLNQIQNIINREK